MQVGISFSNRLPNKPDDKMFTTFCNLQNVRTKCNPQAVQMQIIEGNHTFDTAARCINLGGDAADRELKEKKLPVMLDLARS